MNDFTPKVPLGLQIRRVIFEQFNDVDANFTNDEIFEIICKAGDIDPSWIIDDTETFFTELCDSGLARNIGQNFTTMYLRLFDPLEELHCNSCNYDVYLGESELRNCPNCKSVL